MKNILLIFCVTGALMAQNLIEAAKKAGLEAIPADPAKVLALVEHPQNLLTPAKIELGKMLFFEPRLSKSGLISCATCHNLGLGGADGLSVAIGHGWTANPQGLNTPTVYNAALFTAQFWDGRSPHLADQAKGPMVAPPEMAVDPAVAVARMKSIPEYVNRFNEAFRGEKEPVTFDNIAKAIAAFESTLITPSRFDDFLNGNDRALSAAEKKGLRVFLDKGCTVCHNGVGLGGGSMQHFPAQGKFRYAHVGSFTGDIYGRVRVPSLRNVTKTAPYFHNGSTWSLEEAVMIMGEAQLTVFVTPDDAAQLAVFLKSLEGREPRIVYPQLPRSTAQTPKPEPYE